MKNLLVAQSGGPTAVINASLAGVIKGAVDNGDKIDKIYGCLNGIEGIETENFVLLNDFKDETKLRILKQTPSSYLGSCRKKLPTHEEDAAFYEKIFEVFKKNNIGYFLYIGGNDSMDTVDKLSKVAEKYGNETKIIGVPKTIDNDLALTDHTPGFGSAAKFVANSMRQLSLDTGVYKMPSVIVLEIMGRNAGWLTAAAALGNDDKTKAADIICLPETAFDVEEFLKKVDSVSKAQKTVMIALSEGIKDKSGKYISEGTSGSREDKFAHAVLGGVGRTVENHISTRLGLKTRTIELSTLQRCWAIGASLCDVNEAFDAGYSGVKFACEGMTGIMVGFKRKSSAPYIIDMVPYPVSEIANLEKKVPQSMITKDGFGVTDEFIKYAQPLIQGEPDILYKDGVIKFERL